MCASQQREECQRYEPSSPIGCFVGEASTTTGAPKVEPDRFKKPALLSLSTIINSGRRKYGEKSSG
jgi:hypothetical protein